MKLIIQLWTVRDFLDVDNLDKTLNKIADAGFYGVEFFGFESIENFVVFGNICKKYDLKIVSGHVGLDDLENNFDDLLKVKEMFEIQNFVIPAIDYPRTKEGMINFAQKFKLIKARYQAQNTQIFYHNHAFEFSYDQGKRLLDYLTEIVDCKFEYDIHWIHRGGFDVIDFLQKSENISSLVHLKDIYCVCTDDWNVEYKDGVLGEGNFDLVKIIGILKAKNVKYLVLEQEQSRDIFKDLEKGYQIVTNLI